MLEQAKARIMAGVPAINAALYHRIRFIVGDPVALIELSAGRHDWTSTLILRDIEMERARSNAAVHQVCCPRDFQPESGLSGDRETATAQAAAEFLRRHRVKSVIGDRSLPLIFVDELNKIGIEVVCDSDWGVKERRIKDDREIDFLQKAQRVTEMAISRACETVAHAKAAQDGGLIHEGSALTSERLRAMIDGWLLEHGFSNPTSIVAGGPIGADCHDHGRGQLFTEQPVIIDIFPRDKASFYNGDCTRTVVHGSIPDAVFKMHAAVVAAKAAATRSIRSGVTGHSVHDVTKATIKSFGYATELPPPDADISYCAMTHGTGHGLGLEVHEPPLLAKDGPELFIGDVVTIEPGLYCKAIGGVRIEDLVVVTAEGCRNLNTLPEGLDWKTW